MSGKSFAMYCRERAAVHWQRRTLLVCLMVLYCVAILLVMDLVYSSLFHEPARPSRIRNEYYHHGFSAKFAGHDPWGNSRETLYTNSLGFKDGRVRDVPATAD